MKLIALLLIVPLVSAVDPFNSSECTSCIEKFNYLHAHNKSIVGLVNNINNFCDYYNISYLS